MFGPGAFDGLGTLLVLGAIGFVVGIISIIVWLVMLIIALF